MTLPWIILLTPLLSAAFIALFTQKLRTPSAYISVAACTISFIATCLLLRQPDGPAVAGYPWLDLGTFVVTIGFKIDRLTRTMLFVVTGIGLLIHIYSLGYMEDDDGKSRYFAGLSLFMFSMLGIVFANNFVMMFIFWELVGVSSYVLIGHWYDKPAPPAAANKAFMTNRIGDFGFMLGILMLWVHTGTIYFDKLQAAVPALAHSDPKFLWIATVLVFCGAVGKSAQFPLHVWLPDAMEGPTPVSALIHAATMVAAGVYMLSRVYFLVAASPVAQSVIAFIGITTAVGAALMATQQNDIKRILAYSTLSQLGYMVTAVGIAADNAAMFHLFTHAFFKALLFLGSGAVIYGTHHEQDIWKMGGLKNRLPSTFLTFLAGTLALTGCPGFAGFFSKDAIITAALDHKHPLIFVLALSAAFLTSFYMFRLMVVVFWGHTRSKHARDGHQPPPVMTVPLVILSVFSLIGGYSFFAGKFLTLPHEEHINLGVMALSLFVFAAGAGLAWFVYNGKDSDPISVPLFANRFYIDDFYHTLIALTQDFLASVSATFDRWILDGVIVRGVSGAAWVTGFVLRFLQLGNLQAYAFLFGLGSVALIYFFLFVKP
ncbi:MAG TPA: NADH-quinone oxidoreductase subunit L [Chthoniobacteraceae bacterium]|jgi:NADH-quinone oxidoreductase subunit L|nr:NADH-quinone oxidoreductase subunit L [Chthoniobacteraceae bacterium]